MSSSEPSTVEAGHVKQPSSDHAGVNSAQIMVDIATLREFGTFVRRELDGVIAPMVARASQGLRNGGDIGPNLPSDDLQRMNLRHADCVVELDRQLEALKVGMAILADSALSIAARYSSSDALARTTIYNITPLVNDVAVQDTANGHST